MPKIVLKSESDENVELIVQLSEKLGFEAKVKSLEKTAKIVEVAPEPVVEIVKSKDKMKSKKGKKLVNFKDEIPQTSKKKVIYQAEDEEEVVAAQDIVKVKIKDKNKKSKSSFYDLDDDFLRGF
jgi:hypothetical protein